MVDVVEAALCMLGVVVILALVCTNVVMRYVFSTPLGWGHEIVMYLFTAISVLGISVAYRRGRHLQLHGVQAMLPDSARRILRLVISVVIAAFFVYMIPKAHQLHELYQRFYSPLNRMPRSWLSLALLWSLASMLLSTVYFIIELIVHRDIRPIDTLVKIGLAGNLSRLTNVVETPSRNGKGVR